MPKSTTFLVSDLAGQLREALEIAEAAESSSTFLYTRRLYVYEASYLLAFSAWENMLEQSFLRFMCGYRQQSGVPIATSTWVRPRNLAAAMALLLGPSQYKLWHNPQQVVARSQRYFSNGPHETVLTSALADIQDFAAVRHYVAHRSADTEQKFQAAARRLSGASVVGARAGRLLRSSTTDNVTSQQVTWLERICADLERYARQIAG
tara:strand:+ start:169 stop:789 length:621 start_codon:yes stop_codon:yes gene_type:complete